MFRHGAPTFGHRLGRVELATETARKLRQHPGHVFAHHSESVVSAHRRRPFRFAGRPRFAAARLRVTAASAKRSATVASRFNACATSMWARLSTSKLSIVCSSSSSARNGTSPIRPPRRLVQINRVSSVCDCGVQPGVCGRLNRNVQQRGTVRVRVRFYDRVDNPFSDTNELSQRAQRHVCPAHFPIRRLRRARVGMRDFVRHAFCSSPSVALSGNVRSLHRMLRAKLRAA